MSKEIQSIRLLILIFAIIGVIATSVYAEDENPAPIADGMVDDQSVPVAGVTVYKNSPSGYALNQPDGLVATVSEYAGHNVVIFLSENQTILTLDAMQSNLTLDELMSDQKSKIESKEGYELISEGEITLGGESAYDIKFTYTDEIGTVKSIDEIMSVNNGIEYVIQVDKTSWDETSDLITEDMINSFEFIPVAEDTISKMIKSKMKQVQAPDKGYRRSSYSYTTYEYYSWDYYYDWCYCNTPHINYYCWCW